MCLFAKKKIFKMMIKGNVDAIAHALPKSCKNEQCCSHSEEFHQWRVRGEFHFRVDRSRRSVHAGRTYFYVISTDVTSINTIFILQVIGREEERLEAVNLVSQHSRCGVKCRFRNVPT